MVNDYELASSEDELMRFKGGKRTIAGFGMRKSRLGIVWLYSGFMGPFGMSVSSMKENVVRVSVTAYCDGRTMSLGDRFFKVDEFDKAEKYIEKCVISFMGNAYKMFSAARDQIFNVNSVKTCKNL